MIFKFVLFLLYIDCLATFLAAFKLLVQPVSKLSLAVLAVVCIQSNQMACGAAFLNHLEIHEEAE